MRDWDGATHQQLTHWIMTHQKRSEEVIYTRHKKWSHRQGDITGNAFFVTQRTLCYYYCYFCMCWFSRPIIKESHLGYFSFFANRLCHIISRLDFNFDRIWSTPQKLVRGFAKGFCPDNWTKNYIFCLVLNEPFVSIISSNIFVCVDIQGHLGCY